MQTYFVVALTFFCGALLCFVLLLILFYLQPFGVSATQYTLSLPLPSLSFSLLLSPPLLPFTFLRCRRPPFPAASVFAAYTQNATANFQLRHERELTSLLRSRSLAFALSLPLPPSLSLDASPSQLHMKPAQLQLL